MVFVLGIGLGQAGITAVDNYKKRPRIIIIEPYLSLFKLALEAMDLEALLTYDRLDIYLGSSAVNASQVVQNYSRILPIGRTILFIHPYNLNLIGGSYRQIENELTHRIRSLRDNWHTTRRFGKKMLMNVIANLPSLFSGIAMRSLLNRFKDIPVICVAAGPSLWRAIP